MIKYEINYCLSEEERTQLMAEILPILEKKSKEELDFALHLITLNGTKQSLNLLKKSGPPFLKIKDLPSYE